MVPGKIAGSEFWWVVGTSLMLGLNLLWTTCLVVTSRFQYEVLFALFPGILAVGFGVPLVVWSVRQARAGKRWAVLVPGITMFVGVSAGMYLAYVDPL